MKKRKSILTAPAGAVATLAICALLSGRAFAACETPATATNQMNKLVQQDIDNINDYINQEMGFIDDDLMNTATDEVVTRFNEFNDNIIGWLNAWWDTRLKPAMQDMTAQLNAAEVDQTRMLGSMMDAQIMNEIISGMQEKEVEGHRRYRPHELTCQVDTAASGQTKVYHTARALGRGYAKEDQVRRGNVTGTAAASGAASDQKEMWDQFKNKFCDPDMGDQGCAVAGPMAGKHTDLPGLLWGDQQTIDMSVPDNQELVKAVQRYLIAPFAPDPLPPKVVDSAAGREEMMERRSRETRVNTIYATIGQMVGERSGGSGINLQQMRIKGGVPAGDPSINASNNASYREIMEVMTKERFYDPEYITRMVEEPEQMIREQGSMNALRMQLMNDHYKRSEEMLFMEAAMLAKELDDRKPGDAVAARPLR